MLLVKQAAMRLDLAGQGSKTNQTLPVLPPPIKCDPTWCTKAPRCLTTYEVRSLHWIANIANIVLQVSAILLNAHASVNL